MIYKYHLQLTFVTQHFHFLEIPKTDVWWLLQRIDPWLYEWYGNPNLRPTYGCGVEDEKSIYHCVRTVLYVLRWIEVDYLRQTSGGEGPKMINQYFSVYALRRVRCAGYATVRFIRTSCVSRPVLISSRLLQLRC